MSLATLNKRYGGRSIRERFDRLRTRYLQAKARKDDLDAALHVKYGPNATRVGNESWLGRGERTQWDKAKERFSKAAQAMFDFVQSISPRDWSSSVPLHWIAGSLTFEDAVRSKSEPLSVVPPLSYGATHPIT